MGTGVGLSKKVATAAVIFSVHRRGFWSRIGKHVPPSMLPAPEQSIQKLCLAVAADHAYPSFDLVVQRANAAQAEGSIDADGVMSVMDVLSSDPDMDAEQVITEIVAVLQKDMAMAAARQTVQYAMSGRAFGELADKLRQIDRLGEPVAELDTRSSELGDDTDSILSDVTRVTQMQSGILELDATLGGGYGIMTLTTFMGDTGAGKSMTCSHHAAAAALQGLNVGYVTTELSKAEIHARVLAAITGISITSIKRDAGARKQAIEIRDRLRKLGKLGRVRVEKVDADSATPADCLAWLRAQERDMNEKIDVLIVDYGDELSTGDKRADANLYERGGQVWNGLAIIAHDESEPRWVFTAAQSRRPEFKPGELIPPLTLNSVADSYGKPRKVDYWLSITPAPDKSARDGFKWSIDKHRTDDASVVGKLLGPIPHQRHIGRMGDMSHL